MTPTMRWSPSDIWRAISATTSGWFSGALSWGTHVLTPAPVSGGFTALAGKCLDVPSSSTTLGTQLDIYTCNGGSNQRWELHPDGSITNSESGLCLDVIGQKTAAGSPVDLWTCNGGSNQLWSQG